MNVVFWSLLAWLGIGVALAAVSFRFSRIPALLLIVTAGVLIGVWRGSSVLLHMDGYDSIRGETITLHGRVAEDTGLSKGGDTQAKLTDIVVQNRKLEGVVWVSISSGGSEVKRSDQITVSGVLGEGFGNIPATMYRARLVGLVRPDYADVGRDVRDSFALGIREAIKEPEASLASGFLVGQKTALPEELDTELRLLGLTHIVVASGYNLSILVRYSRRIFAHVSRFAALAAAGLLVFCFVQVTGASPSMARASLVTGLSLVAWFYGRTIHPFVLLMLSAGITIIINPTYAWGDIGWLLSFTSFIGVLMLAPLLHSFFFDDTRPGFVRQVLFETLSAQLVTFPIIAYVFGQYSPLSLLANVLILPLIPFVMGLIFIAGVAGVLAAGIAFVFGFPAQVLLVYMTSVVGYLAELPSASKELQFTTPLLVCSYISLGGLIVFLWRRSGYTFRTYNIVE